MFVQSRSSNLTTPDATTKITFEIEKAAVGTLALSTAVAPNSTAWTTRNRANQLGTIVLYKDPDNVNAWTQATLDTMQIGFKLTTGGTNKIIVTSMWASVDYVPGVASTATGSTLAMMGVG